MIKYRIFNDPDDHNMGYNETLNFSDVPEGAIEGYHYIIVQIEEPDPEQQFEEKVYNETIRYNNRINDGRAQHIEISSRLRASLITGLITKAEYDDRQLFYSQLRDLILIGYQDKALEKINGMGSEVIGMDYYNYLYNMLSFYVNSNFTNDLSRSQIGGGGIKNPPKP